MHFTTSFFSAIILLAAQCQANQVNQTQASKSTSSVLSKLAQTANAATASQTAAALNATVLNCFVKLPNNPLTAQGLSTPFHLQAPCSQSVATQQAFAEAAIYDPATGTISIYHPLIIDANTAPAAAPVVPNLPAGAVVALWFGFNGGVLQLLDTNGQDANNSPALKAANCINGLPGAQGDVFGQVSWCNAQQWFAAANAGVASGKTVIPPLGVDKLGNACPTSRSFEITDACPSDNVPTQYLLLPNGQLAQDTAANRAANPGAMVINNASDEALLTNILDPLIGCTPYTAPSLTNPGENVPALALSELQASVRQAAPIGLVPLNDPDCLLTAGGAVSTAKTNAYRLGVNQPIISGAADGALVPYCQDMVSVAPPFLKGFQTVFTNQASPATTVGNNLFTFLANRYLMSLTQLTCPTTAIPFQPVVCQLDGNGAATACTITLQNGTTSATAKTASTIATSSKAATSSAKATSAVTSIKAAANATSAVTSIKASASSVSSTKANTTLATSVKAASTSALTKAASSTGVKLVTAPASSSSAKTTLAAATTTTTIIVEIITFFIFLPALGSPPPGVISNGAGVGFLVEEEIFIDLPSAANAACTKQFNACAALAGQAFAGMDCLAQMNACQGAASTASATATTPATLSPSVIVPASGTGTVSVAGVVKSSAAPAAVAAVASGANQCTPVTVTVTGHARIKGTGSAASIVLRGLPGHVKAGKFNFF